MAREEKGFEALLKRMPEIAEAVNAFQSEAIQREALQALVARFGGEGTSQAAPAATGKETNSKPRRRGKKPTSKKTGTQSGQSVSDLMKQLDLAPAGKTSFAEFVEEKQPKSNQDKYAVVVYYLEHELDVSPITLDHIAAVFRLMTEWKEPTNVQSGVTAAASRKGTIDTKDFNDIRTTPTGRNFVERGLPAKKAP